MNSLQVTLLKQFWAPNSNVLSSDYGTNRFPDISKIKQAQLKATEVFSIHESVPMGKGYILDEVYIGPTDNELIEKIKNFRKELHKGVVDVPVEIQSLIDDNFEDLIWK